jgi:hypothetical protein
MGRVVDKARQVYVDKGLRSRRVFLVWTTWTNGARGGGDETELSRMELLPTPKTTGIDSVSYRGFSAGLLPEGSIRVEHVSVLYTEDQLRGKIVPPSTRCLDSLVWDPPPANGSFFYEVVEDGRGDEQPSRQKYRISSQAWRQEGRIGWSFVLERISEDAQRDGTSRFGPGEAFG